MNFVIIFRGPETEHEVEIILGFISGTLVIDEKKDFLVIVGRGGQNQMEDIRMGEKDVAEVAEVAVVVV